MEITDEDVVRTLREVVAERPDYVYTRPSMASQKGCLYVHPGDAGGASEPGCVFGHVLSRLGVPLSALSRHEGATASAVLEALEIEVPGSVAEFLDNVQGYQDEQVKWGVALMKASEDSDGVTV